MNFLISIFSNYRLHEDKTILNSIAHRVFIYTPSRNITNLLDDEREKHLTKVFQRLDHPIEYEFDKFCEKNQEF